MQVEIVREINARQVLVKRGDEYFVVSSINAPFSGPETLAFPATAEGDVTGYLEVAGWRGATRDEVIAQLGTGAGK